MTENELVHIIKVRTDELKKFVEENIKPSHSQSLALTHIKETVLWAEIAIRGGE